MHEHIPLRQRATIWLIDGSLLGLFMMSVGLFVPLIEYPGWPVRQAIDSPWIRRLLIGIAMGLTAIVLIYSPLGGRSGAHMNPALTLTYWRLGRIKPVDAIGYITAQLIGGWLGIAVISVLMGSAFGGEPILYASTRPGLGGPWVAFVAEASMTFVLMTVVLHASNRARFARYTGVFAGLLVATYITIEAPLSGMSMNPARTLASAVHSGLFDALWVYFLAPPLGMAAAAALYKRTKRAPAIHCCKLNHNHTSRCIHCGCDGPIHFDQHTQETAA